MWRVGVLFLGIFVNVKIVNACNGYTLKVNSIQSCNDQNVVKLPKGYTVVMDKDCNLSAKGCLNFIKPIKSAKVAYSAKKAPLPPIEGEMDLCEMMESNEIPQVAQAIIVLGLPNKCPMSAKKYCGAPEKKLSLAPFKNQMGIAAGTTEVKLDMEHDSGKTCLKFSFTISKPTKG